MILACKREGVTFTNESNFIHAIEGELTLHIFQDNNWKKEVFKDTQINS